MCLVFFILTTSRFVKKFNCVICFLAKSQKNFLPWKSEAMDLNLRATFTINNTTNLLRQNSFLVEPCLEQQFEKVYRQKLSQIV